MKPLRLLPLAALVSGIFSQSIAFAEENAVVPDGAATHELTQVNVTARRKMPTAAERVNAQTIQEQMIRDVRDLVRYSPDVGIVDNGRHIKGFAMRGVEGNRVGISVDGVSLPDSEENTLYARYGNFNPSRMSIDPELVGSIELAKGSDSFQSGSGALGGNVNYRTLEAGDIVQPDRKTGMLLRSGYAGKNREWTNTAAFGVQNDTVDAVVLYSQRYGHEMKSNGSGPEYFHNQSQHPDPAQHRQHSYLAKMNWQLADAHRIGGGFTGQTGSNFTDERSYTSYGSQWREADDKHKRFNFNTFYEYTPESSWLALLRADYDRQHTDLRAVNYSGARHWRTNEKELDEIKDRSMKTRFQRLTLRLDSRPFTAAGQHTLSAKAFLSQRRFETLNEDQINVSANAENGKAPDFLRETIQYPVESVRYGFSLKDNIIWNPVFSGVFGVRYDRETLKPHDLNAPCSKACQAEGKPGQARFSDWNGVVGVFAQLNPTWKTGYQLATGYRVPTASEMYFTFKNPYGTWKSNRDLKTERSLNHTLSLQAKNDAGLLDLSVYHSRYRDFLFEQTSLIEANEHGRSWQTPVSQTVNIDKARISGLEAKGRLNLGEGWKLSGALGYSRGKLSDERSLLSIQPLKAVIGLDYEQADGKWGIFSRLTYLGGKKPKDAKVDEIKSRCLKTEYDYWTDEEICTQSEQYKDVVPYKYLNKRAYIFDVYGFYRPVKNLTLRAGIYNFFNRKYHTWDALRGINANSTTNTVDRAGKGLERFYAPGRNYAVSLEWKF
ncbi:TonB-dependent hemoglobin/transferrin/lactoferrin family receptor [Neisseria sp. ZJ106]|uniref:TonB-dependent hemoglobin/transferrin/lactoferrin family receptor n=1 Tax=Neisseria lisongii TaxID=2912188 RepID=A0ABY7RKR4_9NEIS|nr:TonB-dependent hemoglobin/transferrin/lactoferrin family receptor [Neisseria lisongii]MCF7521283.1 TonB-dependent hemoglobin/transferrin/lactoferrin family receptor [Neisseria lisongii]WCL72088.1 TonB-dependent hemoglobin/transferrin/lactoferrin family receptor [Neisseria lisongii]